MQYEFNEVLKEKLLEIDELKSLNESYNEEIYRLKDNLVTMRR